MSDEILRPAGVEVLPVEGGMGASGPAAALGTFMRLLRTSTCAEGAVIIEVAE
jgi:hypothetical protein